MVNTWVFGLKLKQGYRRCLQHNPDVQDTGIHLKVDEEPKSSGGSHKEIRGKRLGEELSRTTCQGYGTIYVQSG